MTSTQISASQILDSNLIRKIKCLLSYAPILQDNLLAAVLTRLVLKRKACVDVNYPIKDGLGRKHLTHVPGSGACSLREAAC